MMWSELPCREWTGAISTTGYGTRYRNRVKGYVHRQTWEDTRGPIPAGLWILHHCDNRRCYEPVHLFLGTHADNMADAQAKGRWHQHGGLFGSTNPAAKLDQSKADEIRARYAWGRLTQRALAHEYQVSVRTVQDILYNRRWKIPVRPTEAAAP